ncbi:MAG: hypothetical protein AAB631_01720 [Patescibacteria group bacterium]
MKFFSEQPNQSAPEQEPKEYSKETLGFLKEKIAPQLSNIRTYVLLGIMGFLGSGIYQHETSEMQNVDRDPFADVRIPILETVEDMEDVLHKAGIVENFVGRTMTFTATGTETLRKLAEDMMFAKFGDRAQGNSLVEQTIFQIGRHWIRINNLKNIGIDDPLPEGQTVTIDYLPE